MELHERPELLCGDWKHGVYYLDECEIGSENGSECLVVYHAAGNRSDPEGARQGGEEVERLLF